MSLISPAPRAMPQPIASRDNASFKALKRLALGNTDYRRQGRVWVEGAHLLDAAAARGLAPQCLVVARSFWPVVQAQSAYHATKIIVLEDLLMAELSALESAAPLAGVFDHPAPPALQGDCASVVLDRLQDAGNVGSLLRSAAALGFGQVIALKGTAALWGPKVLRAGMGAHWGLRLIESAGLEAVRSLRVPLLVTDVHRGRFVHALLSNRELPMPCAWAFGHEGQGVSEDLADLAAMRVRIAQPGGEESLNVAAAGAICLHASATAQL